jgi:hypothetical protein
VPSLLHTNLEAREIVTVTSKRYILCFEEELHSKPVYVDFNKDYFFFEDYYAVLAFYDIELWVGNGRFLGTNHREALPRTPTILERSLRAIGFGAELSHAWYIILPRFHRSRYVYFQKNVCGQGFIAPGGFFNTTSRYNLGGYFELLLKRGALALSEPLRWWNYGRKFGASYSLESDSGQYPL